MRITSLSTKNQEKVRFQYRENKKRPSAVSTGKETTKPSYSIFRQLSTCEPRWRTFGNCRKETPSIIPSSRSWSQPPQESWRVPAPTHQVREKIFLCYAQAVVEAQAMHLHCVSNEGSSPFHTHTHTNSRLQL